ncbi:transposase [Mesosutterella multiformis]|uniref:transposase n=1 Tax=Mesosutterella multiformis TaxID=2259133 RepID=UPI001472B9E6|nr:transposase [Mesosutterella multiformis]
MAEPSSGSVLYNVFFDAIRVKIRGDNGIVTPKAVHLALGVNAQGRKEVLGMWSLIRKRKYWLKVFTELKTGGCLIF